MGALLIIACMGLLQLIVCLVCYIWGAHWMRISVHGTDVHNPMSSVDMRGVSTPVLPVTVFPVMEPVVTVVTLGTAYGCAVTESCCSPWCATLTFLREASKT